MENEIWNDWRFQVHWNKLEWVNTRSIIEGKNPFCVCTKIIYLKDNDKLHIGLVIKNLNPCIYNNFI